MSNVVPKFGSCLVTVIISPQRLRRFPLLNQTLGHQHPNLSQRCAEISEALARCQGCQSVGGVRETQLGWFVLLLKKDVVRAGMVVFTC